MQKTLKRLPKSFKVVKFRQIAKSKRLVICGLVCRSKLLVGILKLF